MRHFAIQIKNNLLRTKIFVRRLLGRNMHDTIKKMINNAEVAEKRLAELRNKVDEVRKHKIEEKIVELTHENEILSANVEAAKTELIKLETLNGKKQYPLPGKVQVEVNASVFVPSNTEKEASVKKQKKDESGKKTKEKLPATQSPDNIIDVRKLDFRIGKIIEINKHPDADSLYVEKIDCGEEKPRTVVSGLVNHVPIDEMRDKIVMVLCNLKPVKMRGVTSEAMVMCASSPDKVEVLVPPNDSQPGDLVECQGYPREPEPQLNPKKKIFETCAPDLKTNDEKVACYKGNPLLVTGKGPVVSLTLKGVSVK